MTRMYHWSVSHFGGGEAPPCLLPEYDGGVHLAWAARGSWWVTYLPISCHGPGLVLGLASVSLFMYLEVVYSAR